MQSRREFLKTAAVGFSALIVPPALLRARPARADGPEPVLVMLFLRGAADGLSLVVPHGDPQYYAARPALAVPPASVLDLDGFFGLHPKLAPLLPHHQSGRLAWIHASGSPDPTRSHFDGQDFIENGAPGNKTVQEGWLSRYVEAAGFASPLNAITLGARSVKSLAQSPLALSIPSLAQFKLEYAYAQERKVTLDQIYAVAGGPLTGVAENALSVLDIVSNVNTSTSVSYPGTHFAAALRDIAALIKAQIGVRVAAIDLGGWDHHVGLDLAFPTSADQLAKGLAAFATDLGTQLDRTLVLAVTEFGRRVAENGGRGTDHGHGAVAMALGGGVSGGQVLLKNGLWPGLGTSQLEQGDLAVTTDYRDVFAEVLDRHLGLANLGSIFPNFTPSSTRYPGLFA